MALVEMDFSQNGGGNFAETPLWTNSNPSAYQGAGQLTLSQSISNFKYLKFTIKEYTTWADSTIMSIIISVEDFKRQIKGDAGGGSLCFPAVQVNTAVFVRRLYYKDDTHIYLYDSIRLGGDGTGTNDNVDILVQIDGLN